MNVLLIGSGGREHALAWKIAQSPLLTRLVTAPGNPGISQVCEIRPVGATDVEGLTALAQEMAADLVVVGPEAALDCGIADRMAALGVACFGPTRAAARLETSKAFSKAFADRHHVPTALHGAFDEATAAKGFLDRFSPPYVIKADGLAAGKGVVIAQTRRDAEQAIDDMLGGEFGDAGARVIIEDFMQGEEASLFALCDGRDAVVFGGAQDHKRAFDADQGPNTGGMGAYAPAPILTEAVITQAMTSMIEPTLKGMAAEGAPFRGVLFAGLMIENGASRLVEYNARFGDPECQILMMRLKDDLLPYLLASATGGLAALPTPTWRDEAAICVVMAAKGYPAAPQKGSRIRGLASALSNGVEIFHAGTALAADGTLIAAGGRVLNICARGPSLEAARARAYAAIAQIDWPEGFYRTDIGWRAMTAG